jgi:hypothetical protein
MKMDPQKEDRCHAIATILWNQMRQLGPLTVQEGLTICGSLVLSVLDGVKDFKERENALVLFSVGLRANIKQ